MNAMCGSIHDHLHQRLHRRSSLHRSAVAITWGDKTRGGVVACTMRNKSSLVSKSERHLTLVIPLSDVYVVSCSCGWAGETCKASDRAERVAKEHEAGPLRAPMGETSARR